MFLIQYYFCVMKIISNMGSSESLSPLQLYQHIFPCLDAILEDHQPFLDDLNQLQGHGFHGEYMKFMLFGVKGMGLWGMMDVWVMIHVSLHTKLVTQNTYGVSWSMAFQGYGL